MDNRDHDRQDTLGDGSADGQPGGHPSGNGSGSASDRADDGESAGHEPGQGGSGEQDTSTTDSDPAEEGERSLSSTPHQRGLTIGMLARVRIATASQIATVTTENRVGIGYVRRALRDLETLGFVGHGKCGRNNVYHLTTAGQRAVLESGDIPIRPNAATGEKAIAAGLAKHGLAVTQTLVNWNAALMDWDVEVAHTIDKVRSVISDAVLYRPNRGAEVEFVEVDRYTMSMSRLVEKLYAYDAYSRATYQEGERGTIGVTWRLWQQRYPRSAQFPVVRLVLDNGDEEALNRRATPLERRIRGIGIRIDYAPLPMLQRLPYDRWEWRAIGCPDDQVERLAV